MNWETELEDVFNTITDICSSISDEAKEEFTAEIFRISEGLEKVHSDLDELVSDLRNLE